MSAGKLALVVIAILFLIAVARGYQEARDNATPQTTTYQWVECPAGYTPDLDTMSCR